MKSVLADRRPIVPAPLALRIRRSLGRDDLDLGRGVGDDLDLRDDAKRRQQALDPAPARSGWLVPIRTLASWALPICLALPQTFERDQDLLAELEQLVPAGVAGLVVPPRVWLRELRQVNAGRPRTGRAGIPRLLGGVRDDRGQEPGQVIVQPRQHKLGGPAVGARGCLGVKPVFQYVEVKTRKLNRAKLVYPLVDPVKLELARMPPGRHGSPC